MIVSVLTAYLNYQFLNFNVFVYIFINLECVYACPGIHVKVTGQLMESFHPFHCIELGLGH